MKKKTKVSQTMTMNQMRRDRLGEAWTKNLGSRATAVQYMYRLNPNFKSGKMHQTTHTSAIMTTFSTALRTHSVLLYTQGLVSLLAPTRDAENKAFGRRSANHLIPIPVDDMAGLHRSRCTA
jgi:hypothetical protein